MKETKTHDDYWDCECEHNYIQKKSDTLHCSKCNSHEDEQPDSRVNEVEEVIDCHSCGKTVPKQDSFCSDATYEQYVCSECNEAHYTDDAPSKSKRITLSGNFDYDQYEDQS